MAQDLASDSSEDVSDECEWSDGTLTIPKLSDRLCAKTRESDDESMLAIVLLAE
ncbi:MAG: hypothetical protein ACLUKN_03525 [Bacilli bacterium]